MNLKKLLIMLYCLGLFPLSCIREGQKLKYFTISETKLVAYQDKLHQQPKNDADTIKNDSLFLRFNFKPTFTASININLGWQNQCFANKIPAEGYLGLKTKLISIKLFSNAIFNGKSAGNDLGGLVYYSINGKINSQSGLQPMIDYLNNQYRYDDIGFCFAQKANDVKKHIFTLELQDESGEMIKSTIGLVWK
jgi:hypothetical protein